MCYASTITSESLFLRENFASASKKLQIPPLRYPGFPVEIGGVIELHAAFFYGKPHAGVSTFSGTKLMIFQQEKLLWMLFWFCIRARL
jgi:hypothetical protein